MVSVTVLHSPVIRWLWQSSKESKYYQYLTKC